MCVYTYLLVFSTWGSWFILLCRNRVYYCVGVIDLLFFFFFQAEDGIRDYKVTGVQTCALPIYRQARVAVAGQTADRGAHDLLPPERGDADLGAHALFLIGRPIIIETPPTVKRAPATDGDRGEEALRRRRGAAPRRARLRAARARRPSGRRRSSRPRSRDGRPARR